MNPPPRLRELADPLRGLWLFAGALAAWLAVALPAAFSALALVPALAAFRLARAPGSRVAVAVGCAAFAAAFQWRWESVRPAGEAQGRLPLVVRELLPGGRIRATLRAPLPPALAPLSGREVRLTLRAGDEAPTPRLAPGDTILCTGRFLSPAPPTNPGAFDAERWMAGEDLAGSVFAAAEDLRILGKGAEGDAPWTAGVLDAARGRLRASLAPLSAALWTAGLFGDKSALPADVDDAFRATGLYHILAISGSHMVLLGGIAFALFAIFLPRPAAWAGASLFVVLYTLLIGAPPPVVRATIAFCAVAATFAAGRRPHPVHTLFFAGFVLLCLDPNAPFHAGVQLSFAAVAGIVGPGRALVAWIPRRWSKVPGLPPIAEALAISVGASLATAPLLAWHFQAIPWIGIPAGLLAGVLFSGGLVSALLVLATGLLHLPGLVVGAFAGSADAFAEVLVRVVDAAARIPGGALHLGQPHPAWLAFAFVPPLLLAFARPRAPWLAAALLAAALALPVSTLAGAWPRDQALRVAFLDVGQGDAAIVRFAGDRFWLVDAGPAGRTGDAGERAIVPALRALGARRLEAIVITHAHLDHYGGLLSVLEEIPADRVILPPGATEDADSMWQAALAKVASRRIPVSIAGAGEAIEGYAPVAIAVLAPGRPVVRIPPAPPPVSPVAQDSPEATARAPAYPRSSPRDAAMSAPRPAQIPSTNETSLVLRLSLGATDVLLTGDAERWSEERQTEREVEAEILKVGHHGSLSSTHGRWLSRVHPRLAVISCAARNRYGHPAPATVGRLEGEGADVLVTARDGGVEVVVDSLGFRARRFRERFWEGPWRIRR